MRPSQNGPNALLYRPWWAFQNAKLAAIARAWVAQSPADRLTWDSFALPSYNGFEYYVRSNKYAYRFSAPATPPVVGTSFGDTINIGDDYVRVPYPTPAGITLRTTTSGIVVNSKQASGGVFTNVICHWGSGSFAAFGVLLRSQPYRGIWRPNQNPMLQVGMMLGSGSGVVSMVTSRAPTSNTQMAPLFNTLLQRVQPGDKLMVGSVWGENHVGGFSLPGPRSQVEITVT